MHKPDKRDEIIRAAMELIAEHGFHGAPMALVAERAEVAAGTIYRYFAGKDDLIHGIHAHVEGEILAVLTRDFPAGASVQERFLCIARNLVRYFVASPLEFRFLAQFYDSPYGVAHRREKFFGAGEKNLVVRLFNEARDRGIIKDLPLPVLFALSFGPLLDVCRDHILEFITLDAVLIERTVTACWDGIRT